MDISKIIREARERAGLSQAELARRLDTGQTAVSRYETGSSHPTTETLQRIASALDCELVIEFRPKG